MSVTMTSPALGHDVGDVVTLSADDEAFCLAQGYARKDGYTGVGVSNTGPAAEQPGEDLTLAVNREDPGQSFQSGSGDELPPRLYLISPEEGPAAGGTVVTVEGDNFEGVTGVTFGGVAGTDFNLDVGVQNDDVVTVTTPAGTAGAVDVVVLDSDGNTTEAGGFTYTA